MLPCVLAAALALGPQSVPLSITEHHRLGPRLKLVEVRYRLDGEELLHLADPSGELGSARELAVHQTALPPGRHRLEVEMVFRGTALGYARGHRTTVRSAYELQAREGEPLQLHVLAHARGGPGRPLMLRPAISITSNVPLTPAQGGESPAPVSALGR